MLDKIHALFDSLDRKQLIALALVAIVCIVIMAYYLYRCINPIHEHFEQEVDESYDENKLDGGVAESFSNNNVTMRMFHVPWCGYCKEAKPHFTQFMNSTNGQTINGRTVNVELIDCEDEKNKEEVQQFEKEIEGYPTIILTKDGQNTHYKGDRSSSSSFLTYIKEMLA